VDKIHKNQSVANYQPQHCVVELHFEITIYSICHVKGPTGETTKLHEILLTINPIVILLHIL